MSAPLERTRYPLHITISTLFIALILGLGAVLSWQNYRKTSGIIFSSAETVYDKIATELTLELRGTYNPVADALQLFARTPITTADSLEQRLQTLETFQVALENEPSVVAIQAGYPDGDFFIVRVLATDYLRGKFAAPAGAALVADHVQTGASGERELLRVFYDAELRELDRNPVEETDYDPRTRPWYRGATGTPSATRPYLFYFIGKVGATIAVQTPLPGVTVAADITLDQLSATLRRYQITTNSQVALIDADGAVLGYREPGKLVLPAEDNGFRMARLPELGSDVLTYLAGILEPREQSLDFEFGGQAWQGALRRIGQTGGVDLFALMISPVDELLSEAVALRWQALVTTAFIMLLAIPAVWLVARRVSDPLRQLATEAGQIAQFDFSTPVQTQSMIREVDELAAAMALMKTTINRFLTLINSLAGEQDFDSLLQRITGETMAVSGADGVLTYLVGEDDAFLEPGTLQIRDRQGGTTESLPRFSQNDDNPLSAALRGERGAVIQVRPDSTNGLTPLLESLATGLLDLIVLPLRNRQEELVGALCLLFTADASVSRETREDGRIAFVRALSGFAAVSLESRQLLKMQEALLDAFIKLLAGAIDSKSPYTGGHCQRVPEITRLLAQAACNSNAPAFRDFSLDKRQWEALDIASWLHDCGKVTTPEYVVDKATKLETIYDRIHEIRMRFEVLKRDAVIRYWEQVAAGADRAVLGQALEAETARLDEEFAFVAACNEGGEHMSAARQERLRGIAARTWQRTLDDRSGISWEEKLRKGRAPAASLPTTEKLLDDKVEHLIERDAADRMPSDNPWGFRLDVPQYKYNRGELYNLLTERGTLSAEERYQINDHIVQTIIMLEKLPYPKHLRDVPLIAGCHHETMDGTGYPKRLQREAMPLTARMMAIADIFEALTASDRPYKKAKKLSEAIRIMHFMKQDGHIDPDLFELFLTSGVYLEYARRFLDTEQIDEVPLDDYQNQGEATIP
jgi:HD-GYP domain-containing protein (c-di-GMP phosphodiesterase class II)/HAMP domain-containing protein